MKGTPLLAQMGQIEIDATCSAIGAILGHLTSGVNHSVQGLAINLLAGGSTGFFLGPFVVDLLEVTPGRSSGGICFGLSVIGALMTPTILRALRPWTERNTDNIIGRIAGKVVDYLAPIVLKKDKPKE